MTVPAVEIVDPVILVRIPQLFGPNMSALAMYEATRGIWRANGQRRDRAKYALAVFEGVVREVYAINSWAPAGSSHYQTRADEINGRDLSGRFEFEGSVAPDDVRNRYVGKSVANYFRKGNQNPIMYKNCGHNGGNR